MSVCGCAGVPIHGRLQLLVIVPSWMSAWVRLDRSEFYNRVGVYKNVGCDAWHALVCFTLIYYWISLLAGVQSNEAPELMDPLPDSGLSPLPSANALEMHDFASAGLFQKSRIISCRPHVGFCAQYGNVVGRVASVVLNTHASTWFDSTSRRTTASCPWACSCPSFQP